MSKHDNRAQNRNTQPFAETTVKPVDEEDTNLDDKDLNKDVEDSSKDEKSDDDSSNKETESNDESSDTKDQGDVNTQDDASKSEDKKTDEESGVDTDVFAGIGLDDVINVRIQRTSDKNGTAMMSVESIIELIIEVPLCIVSVKECHVQSIFNHIKNIKRTKRFAVINEKSRLLMIENWKRTYNLK